MNHDEVNLSLCAGLVRQSPGSAGAGFQRWEVVGAYLMANLNPKAVGTAGSLWKDPECGSLILAGLASSRRWVTVMSIPGSLWTLN